MNARLVFVRTIGLAFTGKRYCHSEICLQEIFSFEIGPPRLPLIGSIPFLGGHTSLIHMVRHAVSKYGPVTGIYLGKIPAVIIADYKTLKGKLGERKSQKERT